MGPATTTLGRPRAGPAAAVPSPAAPNPTPVPPLHLPIPSSPAPATSEPGYTVLQLTAGLIPPRQSSPRRLRRTPARPRPLSWRASIGAETTHARYAECRARRASVGPSVGPRPEGDGSDDYMRTAACRRSRPGGRLAHLNGCCRAAEGSKQSAAALRVVRPVSQASLECCRRWTRGPGPAGKRLGGLAGNGNHLLEAA